MWYCALPGCSRETLMVGAPARAGLLRCPGWAMRAQVRSWQTPRHAQLAANIMQERQVTYRFLIGSGLFDRNDWGKAVVRVCPTKTQSPPPRRTAAVLRSIVPRAH